MEDPELAGILYLNGATVEKTAVAVVIGAVSGYLEASSSLGAAKARGCLGTQVNDLIAARNQIVPLAHSQIGAYVESFEVDVAV